MLDLYEEYSVDPDDEEHQNLYFTEDGVKDSEFVHPNSEGHNLMAPLWKDFVVGLMTGAGGAS